MTTFATADATNVADTLTFYSTFTDAEARAEKLDLLLVASPEDLEALSGSQIVDFYNVITAVLGPDYSPVKRFSDKAAAVTRTWIRLQDLACKSPKFKPAAPAPAAKPAPAANPVQLVTVSYASVDGVTDTRKFKTLAGAQRYAVDRVGQHPEMGHNYAASGDGKVSVKGATLKELFTPAAPAPVAEKRDIWRRPKNEAAQRVAYRPVAGSVQAGLYDIITKPGGVSMEEYCRRAAQLNTRDRGLYNPPQVWGALRYLFVTKRGYGLDFDGELIRLLVPADERTNKK